MVDKTFRRRRIIVGEVFRGECTDKANNIISINEDYFLVVGDSSSSIGNEKTGASYGSTDVWALKLFKNGENISLICFG